tara:strand:- start:743 stop:931 length:189 start_codon:yes stop_codon:yes gene_type:complete
MNQIEEIMARAIDQLKKCSDALSEPIMVSDCCSAEPIYDSEDLGICSECKEHCEYININEQE